MRITFPENHRKEKITTVLGDWGSPPQFSQQIYNNNKNDCFPSKKNVLLNFVVLIKTLILLILINLTLITIH